MPAPQARATFGRKPSQLPHARRTTFGAPQAYQPQMTATAPAAYQSSTAPAAVAPDLDNYSEIIGNGFSSNRVASSQPVKLLRFVSGMIDLIFLSIIAMVFVTIQVKSGSVTMESSDGKGTFFIWMALFAFFYGVVMEASHWQGTLGKIMTGTRVVDMNGDRLGFGRALGRNFGKILSGLVPLYIPYLMVFWTEKSQSLHDKMVGTLVYRRGDGPQNAYSTFD
ncbi:RDD family protein [Litorimonas sp. RW-G-Af-16]|uniref:RDD family protein n=1 Tax=Litorimonas sp. RW-G-Af-16 TaxID=3241168 RepID=UPI00390C75DA